MTQTTQQSYFGHAVIGGFIGGVLSSIPLLNILNCCFCLLNGVGAGLGVTLHLKSSTETTMSLGRAAISGAISGAIAGLMATAASAITMWAMGGFFDKIYRDMGVPRDMVKQLTALDAAGLLFQGCFNLVIYPVFGALFAMLTLQLFFQDRSD